MMDHERVAWRVRNLGGYRRLIRHGERIREAMWVDRDDVLSILAEEADVQASRADERRCPACAQDTGGHLPECGLEGVA